MSNIAYGELQLLARHLLRSNNYELFDDPRSEIEVAMALGLLSLGPELAQAARLPILAAAEVY